MSKLKPTVDLGYPTEAHGNIPSFANIEEEAEFWDTHDFTDFPGSAEPVRLPQTQRRIYRLAVSLEPNEYSVLDNKAQELGVSPATLAQRWIHERLRQEENGQHTSLSEVEHGAAD